MLTITCKDESEILMRKSALKESLTLTNLIKSDALAEEYHIECSFDALEQACIWMDRYQTEEAAMGGSEEDYQRLFALSPELLLECLKVANRLYMPNFERTICSVLSVKIEI